MECQDGIRGVGEVETEFAIRASIAQLMIHRRWHS